MSKIVGFIGSGNMGGAMIGGIVNSHLLSVQKVIAADPSGTCLNRLKKKYGIEVTEDNLEVSRQADILFLAVKPGNYPQVIKQIKDNTKEHVIIVTIAAGQSIKTTEALFEKNIKIVRAMPNTPAMVGEGMSAICPNSRVEQEDLEVITEIFNSFGKSEIVGEYLMDVVTGVSGSSPAYVYLFIEALADAAVAEGMPREKAYKFAAQAVYGSAKMVLETGEHPGVLKDMVCSPGGTTIDAVCELEKNGLRSAVISAVKVCTKKSKAMNEKY